MISNVAIYINLAKYSLIAWIISGAKLYEIRSKNMLRHLIGQRVFFWRRLGADLPRSEPPPPSVLCEISHSVRNLTHRAKYARVRAKIFGAAHDARPDAQNISTA